MQKKAQKTTMSVLVAALVFVVTPLCHALPEDYESEATPMVSPQELNQMYGSLPHRKDENFAVLAKYCSASTHGLPKYFLLHRHSFGKTRAYLIVKVDTKGLVVMDERFDNPFRSGNVPCLKKPIPLTAAYELYRQCFGVSD